ncbi:MAG: hypothetical protein M1365_15605 [Actinobacteria bacterium]|nr:hypothetical protein [Actinomycetota bacterium]
MRKLWIITVIGIIIRIILSLTTFHSDMQVFDLAGKLVATGKILDLYDYSSSTAVLNYPPASYLFHGIFSFLFNIFGLSSINQLHLLLLKLPYLIFDLLTGLILLKLVGFTKKGVLAFSLWIFNPVNLYATYMMGQFDIIVTFFIALSVYLVVKNKLTEAALILGFGIAFKLSPIFLVIPLLVLGKTYWEKIKLSIFCFIPYLVSITPYIFSKSFRATALFANQSSKSLYANVSVSGGEAILLFPLFLIFFYLFIWANKIKAEIWKLYLVPLLLFFIFTHFHPQWLIWVTPLLILGLVKNEFKTLLPNLLIILTWLISLFFFDPSLTIGIFAPIDPKLSSLPSLWELLHINLDYNLCRSLIQTVFAAAALYLIYQHLVVERNR